MWRPRGQHNSVQGSYLLIETVNGTHILVSIADSRNVIYGGRFRDKVSVYWFFKLSIVHCFLSLVIHLSPTKTIRRELFKPIILPETAGLSTEKLVIWLSNLASLFSYPTLPSNTFQKIYRRLVQFNQHQEKFQVSLWNDRWFLVLEPRIKSLFSVSIVKCGWPSRISAWKIRLRHKWFLCSNVPNCKTNSLSHTIYSV